MKKIVIVLPSLELGGAESVLINIANNLNTNSFSIFLVVLSSDGPLRDRIHPKINLVDLNTIKVHKSLKSIQGIILELKPDYVLTTISHLNIALGLLRFISKTKFRLILREASMPSQYLLEMRKIKAFLYRLIMRFSYSQAEKVIAQSEAMSDELKNLIGVSADKVTIINNPVDIERIRRMGSNKPIEYSESNNEYIIVAVGRLVHAKGYDLLLEAFSRVRKIYKQPIHLYIIGEGPLKKDLESQICTLDLESVVTLLGKKKNPYPYIRYADMLVLSSRREGFPNVLLEALACGIKIVSTDCISGPSEILDGGKYGMLASQEDPSELAKTICNYIFLDNKSNQRANDYSIVNIIHEYESVLQ